MGLTQVSPAGSQINPAPRSKPIGSLDGPSIRMNRDTRYLNNTNETWHYELFGWAVDPDAPADPLRIHLYVNGEFSGEDVTGDSRSDVKAFYPWVGTDTGFSASVRLTGASTASQTVCAYAIDQSGDSENTTLGCVELPVPGTDGQEPIGAIDQMKVSPGMIHLSGWAGDPDAGGEAVQVRVYYDGTHILTMRGDQLREDVAAVFPQLDKTTGFNYELPISPGPHQVCVYAGNLGRRGLRHTTLDCRNVDIPGAPTAGPNDPQGSVDLMRSEFVGTGHTAYYVAGWAFDPDTVGPWTVRVLSTYSLGIDGSEDTPPVQVTIGTTGQQRPDVQSIFPAAGPNSGYDVSLRGIGKYSGYSFSCVYARQEGAGAGTERFLGCIK